mgnify:CR=1 FL=1|jgi:hypothetical protein
MIVVTLSSFVLATLHDIPFLFAVGVFTAYLTLTGRRFMTQIQRGKPNQKLRYEIIIAVLTIIAGLYSFKLWNLSFTPSDNFRVGIFRFFNQNNPFFNLRLQSHRTKKYF